MPSTSSSLVFHYTEYDSAADLPADEQQLLQQAREASRKAYAPYSRYQVGAALLLEDGTLVIGSNQENAAYPSGLCAERVAFFAAGAQHPGKRIQKVAITAHALDFEVNHPVAPCGACRQAMVEYENRQEQDIRVLLAADTGKVYAVHSLHSLLPLVFREAKLRRE